MTVTAKFGLDAFLNAFEGNVKLTGAHTLKMVLLTTTFVSTWVHYSTVSHELATGSGYTTGGKALTSPSVAATKANTWTASRAATTAYTVGQIVRPASANTYLYRCVVAGTTGSSLPSYPTVIGETVTDGTVRWVNAGTSATVFTSTPVQWTPSTFSGVKGAVIIDTNTGTSSTEPVVAGINFGASKSSTAGPFKVSPDSHAGWGAVTPA